MEEGKNHKGVEANFCTYLFLTGLLIKRNVARHETGGAMEGAHIDE